MKKNIIQKILKDDCSSKCKAKEKRRREKLKQNAILDVKKILQKMNGKRSVFVSENDFVINFCIQLNNLYGESWVVEAENYDDKKRTDVIVRKKYPKGSVHYFFEFKYQRGVLNLIDDITQRKHDLGDRTFAAGEIGADIFKLQKLKEKNQLKDSHYYLIIVSSTSKTIGLEHNNHQVFIDLHNQRFPEKKITPNFEICDSITLEATQSDPYNEKSIYKPFTVKSVRIF